MNDFIPLIYAVLCVAFVVLFIWQQRKSSRIHSEKIVLENENLRLVNLLQAEQNRGSDLQKAYTETREKLIRQESESQALLVTLEREKQIFEESKKSLQDSFKAMAHQALEGSGKQFLELAKGVLSKEAEVIRGDFGQKQVAIQDMMKPLSEVLDRYQKHTQDMEKERQRSYANVEGELKRVVETSLHLSLETSALKNALKKPHIRGRWGEVQLKNCIDLAGMSEFADVSFQDSSTTDGKTLRPDMVVRMPGRRLVVVDAKTPIDAFLASLEAPTDELRSVEMARHGQQVKDHIKKLSSKAYNEHLTDAADFTVMFLPNESFLYAALETQADLVEFALEKKILIATPPTFVGLLKVIRFGWNEEKLAVNAQKISESSQELHKRLVEFVESYVAIGKFLDKAKSEYDTGLRRLDSRVLVQARRLEALGAKSHKELPEELGYTREGPSSEVQVLEP